MLISSHIRSYVLAWSGKIISSHFISRPKAVGKILGVLWKTIVKWHEFCNAYTELTISSVILCLLQYLSYQFNKLSLFFSPFKIWIAMVTSEHSELTCSGYIIMLNISWGDMYDLCKIIIFLLSIYKMYINMCTYNR